MTKDGLSRASKFNYRDDMQQALDRLNRAKSLIGHECHGTGFFESISIEALKTAKTELYGAIAALERIFERER